MDPFTFHVVRSDTELCTARSLRQTVYRQRLGVSLSESLDETERDRLGYVFLLSRGGEPVGTARIVPTSCAVVELRRFGWLPVDAGEDLHCGEVGRIATLKGVRSNGMPTSLVLIAWSARWLLRYSPLCRYVAYNRLALLPLWRRLGALDTGVRFVIAERGGAEYAVIRGDFHEVVSKTKMMDNSSLELVLSKA
ncbi:MAG: hypothetical protein ACRDX8_03220 [Acidimicrobiales bacterium]